MAVRGVFMSNSGIVGERQNTLSGRVLMTHFAGTAPLLALSAGMAEERLTDTAWSWQEDQHISGNTTSTATYASGITSIVVADANIWVPNSIVMVESTGEFLFVTAVSGNTITVVRGVAGTTAASIASGARLQLISSAYPEGGGKPAPVAQSGETYSNLAQIFKNGWAVSGTAKAIQYITGSKLARNKEMAMGYHVEDIERAMLWGKRAIQVINNEEYRMSNGLLAQIASYGGLVESAAYNSVAGNMSIAGLQTFMRKIFDKNVKGLPNERIAFTGSLVVELLQKMARLDTNMDITVQQTEIGLNLVSLSFMGNKLTLLTHPLMNENSLWSTQLYVFHPGLIKKKILRDSWVEEFGKSGSNNNGVDAEEGFVAYELGFHLGGARVQGYMTNISTAVAS